MSLDDKLEKLEVALTEVGFRTQHDLAHEFRHDLLDEARKAVMQYRELRAQQRKFRFTSLSKITPPSIPTGLNAAYQGVAGSIKGMEDNLHSLAATQYLNEEEISRLDWKPGETRSIRWGSPAYNQARQRATALEETFSENYDTLKHFFRHHRNTTQHGRVSQSIETDAYGIINVTKEARNGYERLDDTVNHTLNLMLNRSLNVVNGMLSDDTAAFNPPGPELVREQKRRRRKKTKRTIGKAVLTIAGAASLLAMANTYTDWRTQQEYIEDRMQTQEKLMLIDDVSVRNDPLREDYQPRFMNEQETQFFEEYIDALGHDGEYVLKQFMYQRPIDLTEYDIVKAEAQEELDKWAERGMNGASRSRTVYEGAVADRKNHFKQTRDVIDEEIQAINFLANSRLNADLAYQDINIFERISWQVYYDSVGDDLVADVVRALGVAEFTRTNERIPMSQVREWHTNIVELETAWEDKNTIRMNETINERNKRVYGKELEAYGNFASLLNMKTQEGLNSGSFSNKVFDLVSQISEDPERVQYFLENHTSYFEHIAEQLSYPACRDILCSRFPELYGRLGLSDQGLPENFRPVPLHALKMLPPGYEPHRTSRSESR